MRAVLLDTHAWAWSLMGDDRLSRKAAAAIAAAGTVLVSPISVFEIAQKVRLGKWPEMAPFVSRLPTLIEEQGGRVAALDAIICAVAGTLAWPHRDPFDRLLAATVMHHDVPIISADDVFDTFTWDRHRIW